MNWQTEGVNSNYRSAKFEEISPKKTGDISRESFAFFPRYNIRHRIGICQERHLSMREIPNHVHARAYRCLRSNVYLSEELQWNLVESSTSNSPQKGTKFGGVSSSLGLQNMGIPLSRFLLVFRSVHDSKDSGIPGSMVVRDGPLEK